MRVSFPPLQEGTLNMFNKNNERNTPGKGPPNHHHHQKTNKEKEKNKICKGKEKEQNIY